MPLMRCPTPPASSSAAPSPSPLRTRSCARRCAWEGHWQRAPGAGPAPERAAAAAARRCAPAPAAAAAAARPPPWCQGARPAAAEQQLRPACHACQTAALASQLLGRATRPRAPAPHRVASSPPPPVRATAAGAEACKKGRQAQAAQARRQGGGQGDPQECQGVRGPGGAAGGRSSRADAKGYGVRRPALQCKLMQGTGPCWAVASASAGLRRARCSPNAAPFPSSLAQRVHSRGRHLPHRRADPHPCCVRGGQDPLHLCALQGGAPPHGGAGAAACGRQGGGVCGERVLCRAAQERPAPRPRGAALRFGRRKGGQWCQQELGGGG
jgi:hypothetical protein